MSLAYKIGPSSDLASRDEHSQRCIEVLVRWQRTSLSVVVRAWRYSRLTPADAREEQHRVFMVERSKTPDGKARTVLIVSERSMQDALAQAAQVVMSNPHLLEDEG